MNSSQLKITVTGLTDKGLVREDNEDGFLVDYKTDESPRVIAVADGMGGHEGGEVASALALEVISSWCERLEQRGSDSLSEAVLDANRVVWSKAKEDDALDRMGTTLTVGFIDDSHVHLAQVGDSRAYLLRGGTLQQLTVDQTLVQQLVDSGEITQQEAIRHPQRSFLTQSVGTEPDLSVDRISIELLAGDRLVLSSDGLHGYVDNDTIRQALQDNPDSKRACKALVDAANNAGGHDNVTVLILDASGDGGGEPGGGAVASQDATPILVSKPELGARPKKRSRALIGVGAAVVLAGILWGGMFLLKQATTAHVVTTQKGRVVILLGSPGTDERAPQGEVVERSNLELASLPETFQRELRAGITARSLEEARSFIDSLRNEVPQRLEPSPPPPPPAEVPGPIDATPPPSGTPAP